MKKILKITGGVLALILVALVAIPFFVDLNDYRGKMEAAIEKQVPGKAELGKIHFSLFPYVGIKIDSLAIGDKTIETGTISFRVHLKSLLYAKIITGLVMETPKVQMDKVAKLSPQTETPAETKPFSLEEVMKEQPWISNVVIEEVKITDAQIIEKEKPLLQDLNFRITDIQLKDPEKPMSLSFSMRYRGLKTGLDTQLWADPVKKTGRIDNATLYAGKTNFQIKGNVQAKQAIPYVDVSLDSESIHLDDFKAFYPVAANLEGATLHVQAKGPMTKLVIDGKFNAKELKYGEYNLSALILDFLLETGSKVTVRDAGFGIFNGKISTKGFMGLGEQKPYDLNFAAEGVDVVSLTQKTVSGKANFHFRAHGDNLDTANAAKSLRGEGEMQLADGKIHTTNLIQSAFSEGVANAVKGAMALSKGPKEVALPGAEEEGTPYKTITLPFVVEDGFFKVQNLRVVSNDMEGVFTGAIGLTDFSLDLRGDTLFAPELTASIIKDEKVRGYVAEGDGRLRIPVHVTGTLQDPSVGPDSTYVGQLFTRGVKKAYQEEVKAQIQQQVIPQVQQELEKIAPQGATEEAKKLLDKLF